MNFYLLAACKKKGKAIFARKSFSWICISLKLTFLTANTFLPFNLKCKKYWKFIKHNCHMAHSTHEKESRDQWVHFQLSPHLFQLITIKSGPTWFQWGTITKSKIDVEPDSSALAREQGVGGRGHWGDKTKMEMEMCDHRAAFYYRNLCP